MQLTRTSSKLNRTILFNAEHGAFPFTPPADSGYFSLILIRSGEGTLTVNSQTGEALTYTVTVEPPMAFCLRDGETLSFTTKDGDPWDVYNLVFSPTFINVNMRPAVMEQGVYEVLAETYHLFLCSPFMEPHADLKCINMTSEQMDNYFRICDAAVALIEEEEPDNCWSCRIRANFMDILTSLETQYTHKLEAQRDNSLTFATYHDIVIHIHGDLMHPCRIEEVCRRFGISKNKLQMIFRRYSGLSYYDFIKETRVKRAQCYLAFTDLKLSEIAFRLGFSTEQHFYRFFKRESGIAPADFRKMTVAGRKEAFAGLQRVAAGDPGCYATHE